MSAAPLQCDGPLSTAAVTQADPDYVDLLLTQQVSGIVFAGGRAPDQIDAEAALAAPVWPVVVVVGANSTAIRPVLAHLPVLIVENSAWSEGMASSIREGIGALRQFSRAVDAAILALCDQPAFSAETVAQVGRSAVAVDRRSWKQPT